MTRKGALSQESAHKSLREKAVHGLIFDIKRFAIHDGPGIRTTVFFKGCPLHCLWCHNPEGMSRKPQILYNPVKCIGCGYCLDICPQHAHWIEDGRHVVDRRRCLACGACAEQCFAGALELAGKRVTAREVMDDVLLDRPFYERSGGGLTLSGGEPLAQHGFALAVLQVAKARGIHTALDTSGFAPWELMQTLLNHTDLILFDLKHMDSQQHQVFTGVPNEPILNNLRRIDAAGHPIWVRIPLVPGKNDEDANFHALGQFLSDLRNIERIEILCYHALAASKYEQLGRDYPLRDLRSPTKERAQNRQQILASYGLPHLFIR